MGFDGLTYVWAALTLLVPLLIHLWSKQKRPPIEVGNLEWFETGKEKQARKISFSDLPLLFIRMLMLAVFVLLLLKPYEKQNKETEAIKDYKRMALVPEGFKDQTKQGTSEYVRTFTDNIREIPANKHLSIYLQQLDYLYPELEEVLLYLPNRKKEFRQVKKPVSFKLLLADLGVESEVTDEEIRENSTNLLAFSRAPLKEYSSSDSIKLYVKENFARAAVEAIANFDNIPLTASSTETDTDRITWVETCAKNASFRKANQVYLDQNCGLDRAALLAMDIGSNLMDRNPNQSDNIQAINLLDLNRKTTNIKKRSEPNIATTEKYFHTYFIYLFCALLVLFLLERYLSSQGLNSAI